MSKRPFVQRTVALLAGVLGLAAGAMPARANQPASLRYVGSSTVAIFLRDAEPVYKRVGFQIDTGPESKGGEKAILDGTTDLAGIADRPQPETLRAGIVATFIARDAIAVIVNARNPVRDLSLHQLRALFTGKVRNWKELGGPDLPVQLFIVGPQSATRRVFREAVLDGEDCAGCQEIKYDRDIVAAVRNSLGALGQISFSFLNGSNGVRAVAVEGEEPSVTNFNYPIARPLYLLWREGNPEVEAFVEWTQTEIGQRVVMKHFVGIQVVGSARAAPRRAVTGTLIVYTETYPVYDGGVYYYPHRPYEILTRQGDLIRRVPNHRGENDERPMRISLPPGTYLIRARTSRGDRPEFFVTIEGGQTTEVYVEELLRRPR